MKKKKYLIGLLVAMVMMFLWIFVAVALTGGRDVGEFTDTDKIIMTILIVVEIVNIVVMLIFAVMTGAEYGKQIRESTYAAGPNHDKSSQRRGTGLLVLAFMVAFGTMIGGIILGKDLSVQAHDVSGWLLGISFVVAAVMLLLNIVLQKWYAGRLEKQQVGQLQQFIHSHRNRAEETAKQKWLFIKKWKILSTCYALLLGGIGLCVALCTGILYDSGNSVAFCFVAGLLIMCTFSRIYFQPFKNELWEDKTCVSEEQYPRLYATAAKAAHALGCSGKIRIAFLPNCNVGITMVGQSYLVHIGVLLLCCLSEEELYSVLLHEFAHITGHNSKIMQEDSYNAWLSNGKTPHFFSGITNLFFAFFDAVYTLQYSLYRYASSIQVEAAADQAMLLSGNANAAASALLKIKFYELFDWEKGTQDEPCMYEQESPDNPLTKDLESFRLAMKQRGEEWKKLVNVEIQSRAASHPTLKLRLEALGIKEPQLVDAVDVPDYTKECELALAFMDEQICEDLQESYEERRKVFYLEPKTQIEDWKKAGEPVIAQEYADIVWALRQLGRNSEALKLCERAIEELPDAASCSGYFIRGCYRLHSYDAAGLADIYFAVEHNSNYLEEGLAIIGTFCCLTGNQRELDVYRQKAVELAQRHKDQHSQVDILNKKDCLSAEKLPEGMLEDILNYIRSVDGGQIEKIYLVRKTITEDFFSSVFVIQFDLEAQEEVCSEIMHKIFRYLDTCSDWQFSLFDYKDVMNVPFYKIENSCVYSK